MHSSRVKGRWVVAVCLAWVTLLNPISSKAGYLGLPHGQSAEFSAFPVRSLESGYVLQNDFQSLGVRFNQKVGSRFLLQAEIGMARYFTAVGVPLGLSAYTDLSPHTKRVEAGLRLSLHTAEFDFDGIAAVSQSAAIDLVLGPVRDPESLKLHRWYVSLGIQTLDRDRVSRGERLNEQATGVTAEAGVTYPFLVIGQNRVGNIYGGRLFASLRQDERLQFMFGARYHFK